MTEDESEVKTRIVCYGKNGSVTLDSPHLGDYIYPKIYTLEDENKTLSEVQEEAQALLDGGCDIPSINIKVDFVALEKTVEYREYAVLEEVFLGDMVTVINTKMGFRKQAKVISYEWDCLLEQYNEVELGDFSHACGIRYQWREKRFACVLCVHQCGIGYDTAPTAFE